MTDKMSDARSLLAALKSLDIAMKSSLQALESSPTKLPQGGAVSKTTARKMGQKAIDDAPKSEAIRRNGKVVVSVSIIFMKVGNIDTIHDRFQADVNVVLKWREPALDGTKLKAEDIDWSLYWNPKLSLANGIGEPRSKVSMSVKYDTSGRATVRESRQISGLFFEFMELNLFPFDSQDLTITLVSERDVSEIQLVEDTEEKCGLNAKAFSSEQEWKLLKEVNVWKKTVVKKANRMTKKYPGFNTAAKACRRPQFFIWNIIVIMSVICSMAFATFTVSLTTPHFRLQLTFILLLTTVTFKFAVNKNLPKISYLTLMDKYILSSMVILFCVCVWHAIIGGVIHPNTKVVTNTTSVVVTTPYSLVTVGQLTAYTAATSSSSCTSTTVSASNWTTMADYIALAILLSLYVLLHVVLVILTVCVSEEDMSLNIEVDDDEAPKKEEDKLTSMDGNVKNVNEKAVITFPNNATAGYNNMAYYGDQQSRQNGNPPKVQNRPTIG